MSIPTFGDLRKKFFGGMWHAIGRILQGGLIGFLLAALSIEIAAYFLNSNGGPLFSRHSIGRLQHRPISNSSCAINLAAGLALARWYPTS